MAWVTAPLLRFLARQYRGAKILCDPSDLTQQGWACSILANLDSNRELQTAAGVLLSPRGSKQRAMGNINATPSQAPAGVGGNEHYRAEARKHAELRNQYYEQSQVCAIHSR